MDVGAWLSHLGFARYEAAFRANGIDEAVLPHLTVEDLKEIGVATVGDRRKLMAAIGALPRAEEGDDAAAALDPGDGVESAPSTALRTVPLPRKAGEDRAERRPITVMFCDLVGSTELAARLDAEDWRNLVSLYLDEASAVVAALGGHVLKRLGDGIMALFGYPQAQENDAERAARAALAIQRALSEINARNARKGAPELSARIGLESGPVVVDAAGEVFGEAPNVAARVQALAEPGSVMVTADVQRQVSGLFVAEEKGEHALKGLPRPVALYRLVRASGGGRRSRARTLSPLVGRAEELDLLMRRWERARSGHGQFLQIVGEPGIGKSRLVEEFHARLGSTPHTWVEWSSSQLLQNTPLHPIAEWGRQRFGDAETPAPQRLADLENTLRLIGLDPAEHVPLLAPLVDIPLPAERAARLAPEELRRRQLAALTAWILAGARSQTVALAFEDLHWADPTSLDLMAGLAERGGQAPLFILATTRPDFRAPWSLRSHHSVVSLSPLDRADVALMVGELAQRHALSQEVVEGVSERTGGVPLFVEEVTRLLIERGEAGGLQAIPPTLQQSLAARLDRLGEAREVAQIGAVLGRDFSYALLAAVGGERGLPARGARGDGGSERGLEARGPSGEAALQSGLDRLVGADLLFVEGAGAQATYRFKHALIQDAAYESLLRSRRQALHRRAAEALLSANAEPEAIAHHFTEAGLDDAAIKWWGRAGDRALRRSAFQEAIAHLGKAIAMADKAADAAPRRAGAAASPSRRLKLQTDYGQAMMWSKGFAAEETKSAFARAEQLAAGTGDFSERFAACHGQWTLQLVRGELGSARELASTFLREAEEEGRVVETGVARRGLALMCYYAGDFIEARTHCERALEACTPGHEEKARERFGEYTGPLVMSCLALTTWQLGEVERARQLIEMANRRATELGHAPSMGHPLQFRFHLEVLRGDAASALSSAETLESCAREHGMTLWRHWAELISAWARGRLDDPAAAAAEFRRELTACSDQGATIHMAFFQALLAQLETDTMGAETALERIDDALALAGQGDSRCYLAFIHRLRGEILLKRDPSNSAPAEEAFRTALAVARQQSARSLGLQAALALANLLRSTGQAAEAHALLAPALEGFAPTPEMPEIAEAQALLAALAETDEVQADAAQRRRTTELHAAYGNALIAARGYGAPETTEAFARAREAAFGDKDAPERLAADYGLWAGSYARGELPAMRELSAAFLGDVEARPDSPEAGVAHRVLGTTHWFAGEYAEARDHLERALALFNPGRDDGLAFRFGHDAGVAAMLYLAFTLWPLGNAGRAVSLVGDAGVRITRLDHVGTRAFTRMHTTIFALMRGDISRIAQDAVELARLAREHDLPMWRAYAVFLDGLARAQSGAGDGLEDMRRGAELLPQQHLAFDGLLKIALAEAEARAGDIARALAILDEALATSERIGHRTFDAELHRVRGQMLLKRDPADPAAAEQALLAAIAVAKRQAACSFELRASLSLAKLHQSTARPVEAQAVLAPALEAFALSLLPSGRRAGDEGRAASDEGAGTLTPDPSPERERGDALYVEMPEIAEAQALLAALAETDEVKAEAARRELRLRLGSRYAQAVGWSKGFAAEETKAAFDRVADALPSGPGSDEQRAIAHMVRWATTVMRGEIAPAREAAETWLSAATEANSFPEIAAAMRNLGATLVVQGELREAANTLEEATRAARGAGNSDAVGGAGPEPGISARAHLSLVSWLTGEPSRSRALMEEALARADAIDHVPTRAVVRYLAALREMIRGDAGAGLTRATGFLDFCRSCGVEQFFAAGSAIAAWARAHVEGGEVRLEELRQAVAAMSELGHRLYLPFYLGRLAEIELRAEDWNAALPRIHAAQQLARELGQGICDSFLERLRGEALLARHAGDAAEGEESLLRSIDVARGQGARAFALQSALSLAKLYRSTGRPVEAHAVLAPALEGFAHPPSPSGRRAGDEGPAAGVERSGPLTPDPSPERERGFAPTPEMPEIAEAQALLAALAETDEVRVDAAQRQRRLHLQTAYGQAVMYSKGFVAEETRAAFARAAELAANTGDFSERFAAAHGQWTSALVGGQLKSARDLASAYLLEAEGLGRFVEVGVASRGLAIISYWLGEFAQTRIHCERALALRGPERDREARERFSEDTGLIAMSWLALAMWQLGGVERARELIEAVNRDAAELGHAPSIAHPLQAKFFLESLRRDAAAALTAAEALEALGQKHGMTWWRDVAEIHALCARARLHDPVAGAAELSGALAAMERRGRSMSWSMVAQLAELELRTLGPRGALARIDEALALARQVEARGNLPFVHLVRGEILFALDQTNAAPAEDAFRTAVAIAREQGARSWGLRAALALAKLYQSTGRPVEAHAVLAPALESFSPTPEMPEIAEAQALLAALG